ncbi:hypothetical protein HPP92_013450 [Vanilla planifolia]|uniref:Uncharacterized protein n=1 Tax=Vanilla planifolia TaxID=51239 RepID=A0A835QSC8_VANPL|nr:hypothetical protein HPP92_013450 [Vanilla planifolia]
MHPPPRARPSSTTPSESSQSSRDDESTAPYPSTLEEEDLPVITAASDNPTTQEPSPLPPLPPSARLGESSSGIGYFTEEFSYERRISLEGLRLRNPLLVKATPRSGLIREMFPNLFGILARQTLQEHLQRVGKVDPRQRIQEWLRDQPTDASYEPMSSYRDDQEVEQPVLVEDSKANVGLEQTASGERMVAEKCSEAEVSADPSTLEEQLRPVGPVDSHARVQEWLYSVTNPNEHFMPMDPFFGRWATERHAIGASGSVSYPIGIAAERSSEAGDGGDEVAGGEVGEEGRGEDDGSGDAAAGGH